ncbi:MAG: hypothetical protein LBI86_10800 [Treponema sp.]|jgi:hypothetical protein|nr:hypothetical protein [Treponema sp.]
MANKKIWAIAIFLAVAVGIVYAQNIVLRQQQNLRAQDGSASLTLYPSGRAVFYFNYQTTEGRYGLADGYLDIYESDGTKAFSFPYEWARKNVTLRWVDVGGTRLYQ